MGRDDGSTPAYTLQPSHMVADVIQDDVVSGSGISSDLYGAIDEAGSGLHPIVSGSQLFMTDGTNETYGYTWTMQESTTSLGITLFSNATDSSSAIPSTEEPVAQHTLLEIILICTIVVILSLMTAGGNLMVIISFKMDKQLQTVSNYFLLSLSVADFFIGLISMPLYTLYLVMGRWPLGPEICDAWLSMDYTMSNASVANLLIISFDRYLSVTKPLSYRAKRTPRRAAISISCAWIISAAMWTPWIIAWPYIEGKRTVPPGECMIQFLSSNPYITIITAIAAFYLPVIIMCVLYYKIYGETEKRQKDLANLQANRRTYCTTTRRTDSSDEDVYVNLRRNDSSPEFDDIEEECHEVPEGRHRPRSCWQRFMNLCRIDREPDFMEDSSSSEPGSPHHGAGTPSSSTHGPHGLGSIRRRDQNHHTLATPQQNGKNHPRRENSGLTIPLINVDSTRTTPVATPCTEITGASLSRSSNLSSIAGHQVGGSTSRTSELDRVCEDPESQLKGREGGMYTILIKLPDTANDPHAKPSIRMIAEGDETEDTDVGADQSEGEHIPLETRRPEQDAGSDTNLSEGSTFSPEFPSVGRRLTQSSDALRAAMQARIAMRLAQQAKSQRIKKKRQEKKQEKKAAKTLSAILLAFVITWTPYNVFTVINVLCGNCINTTVYAIGKYTYSSMLLISI